jgi:AcrR family transcriptional regulator
MSKLSESASSKAGENRRSPRQDTGRVYAGLSLLERRSRRRDAFIQAGIHLFGRDGFDATTTRALCSEAGLTQRYFYEMFDSMEDLFLAVCVHLRKGITEELLRTFETHPKDPRKATRAILMTYFQLIRRSPETARILLVEAYTASRHAEIEAHEFVEELAAMVRQNMPWPGGQGLDPRLVTVGLVGAARQLAMLWTLSHYKEPIEQIVDAAASLSLPFLGNGSKKGKR